MKKIIEENWDEFLHEYFLQSCEGCPDGHSSFWRTVITSPQWKAWKKYAWEEKMLWDFPECEELGIISEKHFQDFLKFCYMKKKIIEKNEFGIKRTDNRLCLLCKHYISLKIWKKHLPVCERKFKKLKGI